jgi:methanogenic corrinoid protein MtbC1
VARLLGTMWDEDLCDFTRVTVGLARLTRFVHQFSPEFQNEGRNVDLRYHALLVPAPGEQHTLGLTIVTEFFRRGGWTVWSGAPRDRGELVDIVRREWFSMIGFSMACGERIEELAVSIRQIRRASRNQAIGVMVGGPVFVSHPDVALQIGADATASDGPNAVRQAHLLTSLLHTDEEESSPAPRGSAYRMRASARA